jgi:hypothetical protein
MIIVENIPGDLLNSLNEFSDWFFKQDRTSFKMKSVNVTRDQAMSLSYLHAQQQKGESVDGYPESAEGLDLQYMQGYDLDKFYPAITKTDTDLRNFLGAKACALKMYYPAGGFIDWHTNANAYGYNVLFTYSTTGDGAFLFQHPITKEIVELHDKPGWNMKVGMYDKLGGYPLWHAAYTNCERLTWAYILDEIGWMNLVDDIDIDVSKLESIVGELKSFRQVSPMLSV